MNLVMLNKSKHRWAILARTLSVFGRGDDIRLETLIELKFVSSKLFELILLLNLDKQFSIEQFEPTVSRSALPSPPLKHGCWP